jgi:hypothetical protein
VVDGACAPSYLEAWLSPLGAYTLLGMPPGEVGGTFADLSDLAGRPGGGWVTRSASWAPGPSGSPRSMSSCCSAPARARPPHPR